MDIAVTTPTTVAEVRNADSFRALSSLPTPGPEVLTKVGTSTVDAGCLAVEAAAAERTIFVHQHRAGWDLDPDQNSLGAQPVIEKTLPACPTNKT